MMNFIRGDYIKTALIDNKHTRQRQFFTTGCEKNMNDRSKVNLQSLAEIDEVNFYRSI